MVNCCIRSVNFFDLVTLWSKIAEDDYDIKTKEFMLAQSENEDESRFGCEIAVAPVRPIKLNFVGQRVE